MGARGIVLLGLLVIASLPPAEAARTVQLPAAHVGDQAVYSDAATGEPALALTWMPAQDTRDRWGHVLHANVLRMRVPAPPVEGQGAAWYDVDEAYTGTLGPVSRTARLISTEQLPERVGAPLLFVQVASARNITQERNTTDQGFAPAPWLRACFAHHDLQGKTLPETLAAHDACPVLRGDQPVRGEAADFHGHAGRSYTFDLQDPAQLDPATSASQGTLRLVFAEGWPVIVEASTRTRGWPRRSLVRARSRTRACSGS
ncbi:MAG: hypothetical protein LC624_08275 [Halobacteriales archaeon]|nr:hypothetical protein [Halobacteriales archaeon]